jgi:diguanylate cyclase (GGDEF)-like protein
MSYLSDSVSPSVAKQSSAWVLPLSLAVLCVLMAVFSLYSWQITLTSGDNEIAHINQVVLQNSRAIVQQREAGFKMLGQRLSVLSESGLKTEGQTLLDNIIHFPNGVRSIAYITAAGGQRFYASASGDGADPATVSVFSREIQAAHASSQVIKGAPEWDALNGEWLLPIFFAVRNDNSGEVVGTITARVTLQDRLNGWEEINLGRDTRIVVVGVDGIPRYSAPDFNSFSSHEGLRLMQSIMSRIRHQDSNSGWLDIRQWTTGDNVDYRVHFARIEPGLYSLVLRPREVYRQALLQSLQPAFWILLLLVMGTVFIHILVMNQQRRYRAYLLFQAHHDPLTGLLNRGRLLQLINSSIHKQADNPLTLVLLNLDYFNRVNDQHGHSVGDQVLRQVPARLQTVLSSHDWVARHSGDEFMIVLRDANSLGSQDVLIMALMASLQDEFEVENRIIRLGVSVGVATYPEDASSAEDLLGKADAALHKAKADGRGQIVNYSCSIAEQMLRSKKLEHEMEGCWKRNEMRVHYQPQVDCQTGELVGAEALVRWYNRDLGNVSPAEFIPLAEATGMIRQIDTYVMREACAFIQQLSELCQKPLRISVNLSPANLLDSELIHDISGLLSRYALEPQQLTVEITETAMLNDFEKAAQQLSQLRAIGVGVSVDDFGTGYSSLAYIHKLPVTEIKIDRSFIDQIGTDPHDRALTSAVIAMGRRLQLEVVAEGVEDAEQWRILAGQKCDTIQGYHIARPMHCNDFLHFARTQRPRPAYTRGDDDQTMPASTAAAIPATSSAHS